MKNALSLIIATAATLAQARGGAGLLDERAATACNRDLCYRALLGKTAIAADDCASYLAPTVVCPSLVTVTSIISVQSTIATTATTTIFPANPIRQVFVTSSFTVTETTTQTVIPPDSTVTSYNYYLGTTPNNKRSLLPEVEQVQEATIAARDVTSTCSTIIPTASPSYASACSGTVRYQSACSCLGASKTTVTSKSGTIFTTVTSSTTLAPITSIATVTSTVPQMTFTVEDDETTTRTVTVTTTGAAANTFITTAAAACPTFKALALNGLDSGESLMSDGSFMYLQDTSSASKFVLHNDGKVYPAGTDTPWVIPNAGTPDYNGGGPVNFIHWRSGAYHPVQCVFYNSGITVLVCTDNIGATNWQSVQPGKLGLYRDDANDGSNRFLLWVFPAC